MFFLPLDLEKIVLPSVRPPTQVLYEYIWKVSVNSAILTTAPELVITHSFPSAIISLRIRCSKLTFLSCKVFPIDP